jgi:hypothetical protein
MSDARNHYPQIKHHTPPPKQGNNTPPDPQTWNNGPVVSQPNSVSDDSVRPKPVGPQHVCCAPNPAHYRQRVPHGSAGTSRPSFFVVLLRKEVIQPHLPVRLPCYDFVPIADPTFDGSLPHGVRPPASGVTDFHDVTGGVYKARERIHRSVADLRLLATPTSRGRVADPDPN